MTIPNVAGFTRSRLARLVSNDMPDAFFDYAAFRMFLPAENLTPEKVSDFDFSTHPSRLKQQVAHESFHVIQALRYPVFGNYTNYYWKRAKVIIDYIRQNGNSIKVSKGIGWEKFSASNINAESMVWSNIKIQDRYDQAQFSELEKDHSPTSLYSLIEATAISFQVVATQAFPDEFFKNLPNEYTCSHDLICASHLTKFDLHDHFIFVATLHPFLACIDHNDNTRSWFAKLIVKNWPTLRNIYDFFLYHESAARDEIEDCILDFCDDLHTTPKEIAKLRAEFPHLEHIELARLAASIGIMVYLVTEILGQKWGVKTRVRHTPLSSEVEQCLVQFGWNINSDFAIPLLISSKKKLNRVVNSIVEATSGDQSSYHDVATVGNFLIETVEAEEDQPFACCNEHGVTNWKNALNCSSIDSLQASLKRLELPDADTLFCNFS